MSASGKFGAFTFVLHSHLPYARLAGRWPHGEEWIHEAATETYLPLLQALYDLRAEGIPFKLTIGLTPILTEQLADADILAHLDEYIDDKIARARKDIVRFSSPVAVLDDDEVEEDDFGDDDFDDEDLDDDDFDDDDFDDEDFDDEELDDIEGDPDVEDRLEGVAAAEVAVIQAEPKVAPPWWAEQHEHLAWLAQWYLDFFEGIKSALHERFKGDIVGAFRLLQDEGYLEIITCAATHGYLPLIGTDSAIHAQLRTGTDSYKRHFGRAPRGIWLPECAYRPAYYDEKGKLRPGLELFLGEEKLKVFFTETHMITGGQPVGVAAGETIGAYGTIKRRYTVPMPITKPETEGGTTFQAYYVADTTDGVKADHHSGVSVIGRNNRLGMQVWSAEWGYPGDLDYREFHRKDDVSGFQYWRVTGPKVDLGGKELWHPDWAAGKVEAQADHFTNLLEQELREYHDQTGKFGIIDCNYDTELFGHWWFEGVAWLKAVLRRVANSPNVELTTASDFVEQHPPETVMNIPEGSWGSNGTHFTWDNEDTHWMWLPIREAESRMEKLVAKYAHADSGTAGVLNQTARELLLLESSDWPFLVTTGQAREYAIQRFSQHVERFNNLADSLDQNAPDSTLSASLWELDRIFPGIDFHDWSAR